MKLGETGTVYSFVVVHYVSIPAFEDDVPYVVAHITLDGTDDQVRMISNVIECPWQEVRVGMPVRLGYPIGIKGITQLVQGPQFATGVGLVKFGAQALASAREVGHEVRRAPMRHTSEAPTEPETAEQKAKFWQWLRAAF